MQKFVLPIILILLMIAVWLFLGWLGLWDDTGHQTQKHARKIFLKDKKFKEEDRDENKQE